MDTSSIDQAYGRLQTEFQDVAKSIQALAEKLQAASQGGDANAKEWLLDLKQVARDVKDEQIQVNTLLQAIHGFVDASNQQLQQQQQPQQMSQPMGGGMGGGCSAAVAGRDVRRIPRRRLWPGDGDGAGIGLGEDLINSIF